MSDPLLARLAACAGRVNVPLDAEQAEKIAAYLQLLHRWNRSVNLTSLPLEGFPDRTLDRLVGEPLAATTQTPPVGRWFDLGSGGGSPAVPMKVLRPGLQLTMVEARERKSAFLREAVRTLELPSAQVVTARFGELTIVEDERADLVTVRAVKVDDELVRLLRMCAASEGLVFLFGRPAARAHEIMGFNKKMALGAGDAVIRILAKSGPG